MSPLPGWNVIPPRWAEAHRPTAESGMQSPASITRISAGPAPYPLPADWPGGELLWEGTARVQELKRDEDPTAGEQPSALRQYLVQLPLDDTNPLPELRAGERGDIIKALGRDFRITSLMFGSYEFGRDVICVDNMTQQNPS